MDSQDRIRIESSPVTWPGSRPFALFLSHDIDQIHDRELWRVLADFNHIRRVVLGGEQGSVGLALRRISRALLRPKPATKDFETILRLERRYGFRSTFFVLHDGYWARRGGRFRINSPAMRAIGAMIKDAGCEIAVHGGFYHFNDSAAYRRSREEVGRTFGVEPIGIRNHLLRFGGDTTWRAQCDAGFSYDATFGQSDKLGPRDGRDLPFWAVPPMKQVCRGLVELPLTVMDSTLFRYMKLAGQNALDAAWSAIEPVAKSGGLVTLSWHNNYFNEPEYWDWQWAYERLLERLAEMKPWCATGAELDRFYRAACAAG